MFFNLLILNSINHSKLNLPVSSMNSSMSITSFGSPSRSPVLIFLHPTFFCSTFLGSSYFLHSRSLEEVFHGFDSMSAVTCWVFDDSVPV